MIRLEMKARAKPTYFARLRRPVPGWRVVVMDRCIVCGLCIQACPMGVLSLTSGLRRLDPPKHELCLGPACGECAAVCPVDAFEFHPTPDWESIGDRAWSATHFESIDQAAESGQFHEGIHSRLSKDSEDIPRHGRPEVESTDMELDAWEFDFPAIGEALAPDDVSMTLALGQGDRAIVMSLPFYGATIRADLLNPNVMLGRARAAHELGVLTGVAIARLPDSLTEFSGNLIRRIGPDTAGLNDETLGDAPVLELQIGPDEPGTEGLSGIYTPTDLRELIGWIRTLAPRSLLALRVVAGADTPDVAITAVALGADILVIEDSQCGFYSVQGIWPFGKRLEQTLPKVHQALSDAGQRDVLTVVACGGIRSPYDVIKTIALGADGAALNWAELAALGCMRCGMCKVGVGCPMGIVTGEPTLAELVSPEWATQRLINLYLAWATAGKRILASLGISNVRALRGKASEYLSRR